LSNSLFKGFFSKIERALGLFEGLGLDRAVMDHPGSYVPVTEELMGKEVSNSLTSFAYRDSGALLRKKV